MIASKEAHFFNAQIGTIEWQAEDLIVRVGEFQRHKQVVMVRVSLEKPEI